METIPRLIVRTMRLDEVEVRVDYFHCTSDEYLQKLGVSRDLLPTQSDWRAFYEENYARPLNERLNYSLVWELNGRTVGFSSADHINFGKDAYMHLHILDPQHRHAGLGTRFVGESAHRYFEDLELERIYCEPNALNTAPNRTLQKAGFKFICTRESIPGPLNFLQPTNLWLLDRPDLGRKRIGKAFGVVTVLLKYESRRARSGIERWRRG